MQLLTQRRAARRSSPSVPVCSDESCSFCDCDVGYSSHNEEQLQGDLSPAPVCGDGSCSFCDFTLGYCSHNEEQLHGALPPAPVCRDGS